MSAAAPGRGAFVAALVLALCLLGGPLGARADLPASHTHGGFYAAIEAAIDRRYPPLQDPGLLDTAERIALLNALQILTSQAILEIDALMDLCPVAATAGVAGATGACHAEMAALSLKSQVLALDEACRVGLVPAERVTCLIMLQLSLGGRELMLYAQLRARPLLDQANLWRVWESHGQPDVAQWAAIPALRRSAEVDAILLFVSYFRLRALEQQAALADAVVRELRPEGHGASVRGLLAGDRQMQLNLTRIDLQRLWNYQAYRIAAAGSWGLHEWLDAARTNTVPASSLPLPRIQRPVLVVAAKPADAAAGPAPAPAVSAALPPRRPGAPVIWVRDGAPIFLPDGEPAPVPVKPMPGPGPEPEPAPPDVARGPAYVLDRDSVTAREAAPIRLEIWQEVQDTLNWKAAEVVLERSANDRTIRAFRDIAAGRSLVGYFLDAVDVFHAARNDDAVAANVAAIKMMGGPAGVVAMELTGFEAKLRTLEGAGYDIPQVMTYGAELAQHVLNPFSFGQPPAYSQIAALRGPTETVTTPPKVWLDQVRDAIEDSRRRGGR